MMAPLILQMEARQNRMVGGSGFHSRTGIKRSAAMMAGAANMPLMRLLRDMITSHLVLDD
jgi:hypothetical protein